MLAYRHAFHAGNHADVLKHCVLQQILLYMNQKDKPYWVIDTHAGAGMYSLESEYANTKGEYHNGVARLQVAMIYRLCCKSIWI
jgi:23S rRNA (adenine2030-N6)-methyltransferase